MAVEPNERSTETASLYTAGKAGIRVSVAVAWGRALLGAAAAFQVGSIVDRAASGTFRAAPLLILAGILTLRAVVGSIAPLASNRTAVRVESDLRRRVLSRIVQLGPWTGRRTGETVNKATEGVESVGALAGTFLPHLISGISIPLVLAGLVAIIDWVTGVVMFAVIPLIPALLRLMEKRFSSVSTRYRSTADRLAAQFQDGLQGLKTLTTLGAATRYGERIAEEGERLRSETMRLLAVNQLALLGVDTLFTLGTVVAAAAMAAIRLSAGVLTIGEALTVVIIGSMLIEPLTQIGRFFYVGAIGRASAAQIKTLLADSENGATGPNRQAALEGAIGFDSVDFTYPDGTTALSGVSFRIEPGERVALVGRSGAGKSTLGHLILGLLQPTAGVVAVGGSPALVPQRPFLFHGSIAENLRVAQPGASDAELWGALEAADLRELVETMPDGLDSPIGERGQLLSGGEAQRLAIARALLANTPIVVLDEPTSNIDLESEARLRTAIDRLTTNRTVVIIAHRRSTIEGSDRALLLEAGELVETLAGGSRGLAEALGSGEAPA